MYDTNFTLLPNLLHIFSNRGCSKYKNTTPPIPNLIDVDKAILP